MRVLITGGAGFIGSHLCKRLIERGDEVLCLDSLLTGKESNIRELLDNRRFTFIQRDVILPFEAEADRIFNLACPASPPRYQADAVHTAKTSVLGALNMLELARQNGARILQASTSEVYGDPQIHPQPEHYRGYVNPVGPRACYDEGKRIAETLFFDYARQYDTDIKVIRIFNTYGPLMDPEDGRVISSFVVSALTGRDIVIYGNGQQTRSFCYVDDLIEGMLRMMNSRRDFRGPVNLGNPEEYTVLELAGLVVELTGSRSQIVFAPLPQDDPARRKPSIELAINELGWKPHTSLREGLKRTIAYYDDLLGKTNRFTEKASVF